MKTINISALSLWVKFIAILAIATSALSAAAAVSPFCELLLTRAEVEALRKNVNEKILVRTSLVREGNPFAVDAEKGVPIDVLEGLNRGMAKPILDLTARTMFSKNNTLSEKWVRAAKEEIKARYEKVRSKNQEIEAQRRALKASGRPLAPGEEPLVTIIENDRDGLPLRPLVQAHRKELAMRIEDGGAVPIEIDLALMVRRLIPGNPGPAEIESRLAQALIEGAKFKEPDKSVIVYKGVKARFAEKIKAASAATIERIEDELAASQNKVSPEWNSVFRVTMPLYIEMTKELLRDFPLDLALAKDVPYAVEAHRLAQDLSEPPVVKARVNTLGVPEIVINEIGVRAYFSAELGAPILESSRGLVPNRNGIVVIVHHGAGSVVSDPFSWKYIFTRFVKEGMNLVAPGLPRAGIGMDIGGVFATTAYIDISNRWIQSEVERIVGPNQLPLVLEGRSMGSQSDFVHALLSEGSDNPISAYVLTSLSVPHTIESQTARVLEQVKNGSVGGIVMESLNNAIELSRELVTILDKIKSKSPDAFKRFGDKLLFLQGEADRDGGPTVIEDLARFRAEYAPYSHAYIFEDPLKKYPWIDTRSIPDDGLEAQHILFSNQSNFSKEMGAKRFPGVPVEDLPALQDQFFEGMAVQYGFFDYLADSTSTAPEMVRSKEVFSRYRLSLCGRDSDGNPRTFLDWYRERAGISLEAFAAASPGRTLAGRLKRVSEYWKNEKIRIDGLSRELEGARKK